MSVKLMGSRKKSRVTMIIAIIVLGLAVLIIPVYGLYRFRIIKEQHENEIRQMQNQLDEWQQKVNRAEQLKISVYVPKKDISMFSIIKEDLLNNIEIYTSVPQEYYLSEADFGKMTAVELLKGLPVMKDVLIDERIDADIREDEFNMFLLPSNLKENEMVDVRITFPNGEDYIILTKKKVYGLSPKKNTIWIWLNETEIHRISSAIIDAYMNPGTKLYVLKYVQPETQDGITPTYIVNEHVMEVMRTSPNILELAKEELVLQARKLMEDRLKTLAAESVSAVESNINTDAATRKIEDIPGESQANAPEEGANADSDGNAGNKSSGEEAMEGQEGHQFE